MWHDNKGIIRQEVPVPMLTLAATAVSSTYFFITGADRLS